MSTEETQEELKEEQDIEETSQDAETTPEEVVEEEIVEEEIVDTPTYLRNLLEQARAAAPQLSRLQASVKNEALVAMAEGLEEATDALLEENEKDLEAFDSKNGREAMADRLRLTPERVRDMADGLAADCQVARSRRSISRHAGTAQRHEGGTGPRAHRGHRDHLRVPPERHGRCRGLVSQIGQRLRASRRFGGHSFQYGHRPRVIRSRPKSRHSRRGHFPGGTHRTGSGPGTAETGWIH